MEAAYRSLINANIFPEASLHVTPRLCSNCSVQNPYYRSLTDPFLQSPLKAPLLKTSPNSICSLRASGLRRIFDRADEDGSRFAAPRSSSGRMVSGLIRV